MRKIKIEKICDTITTLFIKSNCVLPNSNSKKLNDLSEKTKGNSKYAMDMILKNCEIAKNENIPLCQDTGIAEIFMFVGQDVFIDFSSKKFECMDEAVNKAVENAYEKGYFRKSVVNPLSRKNNGKNIPGILHIEYIKGDKIKIYAVPKGFGCENMSALKMFNPTVSFDEIADFIIERIKFAGPNPCPPVTVGVGIGGTSEKAMLLAKMALSDIKQNVNVKLDKDAVEYIKKRVLAKTKNLNIGPLGFGGENTVLNLNINTFPTHIAGLPCAVVFSCWCNRWAKAEV